MPDVLVAVLVVALLGAAGLALLAALTVVPFVLALQQADRRGASTARAGAVALVASLLGPVAALLLALRTSAPAAVAALPLLVVAAGPVLATAAPRWLGRRGRHQARAA